MLRNLIVCAGWQEERTISPERRPGHKVQLEKKEGKKRSTSTMRAHLRRHVRPPRDSIIIEI